MKKIAFVSGKGGTGKSTLVASLCELVDGKMMADCDVDAPNLHILFESTPFRTTDFYGTKEAVIDPDICVKCGRCRKVCRFDAISRFFEIKPFHCEGCGACRLVCPTQAIHLERKKTGEIRLSVTKQGTFADALLDIGAEGSGKLVTTVRRELEEHTGGEEWTLIDGSPGIGCVVIASITGVDGVVAVTESTYSGLSDLKRVLAVARHFGVPGFVCINKFDINREIALEIEEFCRESGFPVIGRIAFDPEIVKALRELKTPVGAGNQSFIAEMERIWAKLQAELSSAS